MKGLHSAASSLILTVSCRYQKLQKNKVGYVIPIIVSRYLGTIYYTYIMFVPELILLTDLNLGRYLFYLGVYVGVVGTYLLRHGYFHTMFSQQANNMMIFVFPIANF